MSKSRKCQLKPNYTHPTRPHPLNSLLHPSNTSMYDPTHLRQIDIRHNNLIQRRRGIPLPPAGVSARVVLVLALAAVFPGLGALDGRDLVLAAGGGGVAAEVPAYEARRADHDCHEGLA